MRLLMLRDNEKLSLTKDLITGIPPYAILSHTWGDDDQEVTLRDITDGTGQHKAGYQKILFCMRQAASDGLQYFWVDTCCIDKANHTEFSEAINSMFRWYRNATKCYVYLEDVPRPDSARIDDLPRSEWKLHFRKSRWFSRGWTLQELIAPSSVEFFSTDGYRLGNKKSLELLLHDITGIPVRVLQGHPLSGFGVEERVSWSKGRRTKREEDKAYSLLGMLEVSMLPNYGEGEEKAFARLREEIRKPFACVFDKLPIADGAAFDSHAEEYNPTCHPDTRVDLLHEISRWAENSQAKSVFWLNGMAGTGKSTISRTLANSFSRDGRLGASFFFKRGEGDRGGVSKFFTTITAQLVERVPALAPYVKNAIDADPAIFGKVMREQFEKLILEPLSKSPQAAWKVDALVIVVDALDECERDENIKTIIHLFSRVKTLQFPRLRIFVTSRPELPIRLGFIAIEGTYQNFVLHKIPEPVIKHDLSAYFKYELTKIRDDYNCSVPKDRQLSPYWPEQSDIQILVEMAIPLFIFAATACRFLADRKSGNPDKKLQKVLKHRTKSQESKLDATYLPVLDQMLVGLSNREINKALQEFRDVVGSIVVLASPLSTSALARMLNMAQDTVDDRLDLLHSVLDVPSSSNLPIRLLHLSFRDFLLDPEKSDRNSFYVNEKETHRQLAAQCLRVMDEALRTDICGIQWPGTPYSSIDPHKISDNLRPEIQYACQYWVYHMQQAGDCIYDGDQVHDFLKRNFLHWLEALSLIGRASESLQSIKTLQLLQAGSCTQLSYFLDDAIRFILANVSIIRHAPLQIYCSALTFAPEKSVIRNMFQNDFRTWISLYPKVEMHWGKCLQTLEGHSHWVNSVAFSHDSKLVASASHDETVRIWLADTGELQQTLKGHSHWVNSVAFSHDSKFVASASHDKTVRIWLADTGELQQTLKGHSDLVNSVAFSHDSKLVASASGDKTVRIWLADTGELQQTLEGHSHSVCSVAFSHDSKLVASASHDKTVRIWLADTGELQQTLKGHSHWVNSVAFSHDSKFVASASGDETVRIWSADTGELQQTLKGHSHWVNSVAFSHDSKLVASASGDKTVRIWSADMGELQQTLKGHSDWVNSVAFSHDSKLVASASHDKTVRIWSAVTGDCLRIVNLGTVSWSLSFDKGQTLFTDTGIISIDGLSEPVKATNAVNRSFVAPDVALTDHGRGHRLGYGLSTDRCWITLYGNNLFWLPANSRPFCSAVSGPTVVIGCSSGKVNIIRFSAEGLYDFHLALNF